MSKIEDLRIKTFDGSPLKVSHKFYENSVELFFELNDDPKHPEDSDKKFFDFDLDKESIQEIINYLQAIRNNL